MNTFAIDDRVELISIPEQVIRDRNKTPETYEILLSAFGRTYSVKSFNNYDMAEIWLNDDGSEDIQGVHHSIWIEKEHLKKVDLYIIDLPDKVGDQTST